ncbi:uroporphyrinogen-III C-methyltransferase [Variovorax sp. HJSM1_2]|uniref:uroporphyrinogen-III C-methyltransferase n=1 Tax=Variovorax sp. HJSM1_2 TaxID=3366263 RepID=UPI003BEA31B6
MNAELPPTDAAAPATASTAAPAAAATPAPAATHAPATRSSGFQPLVWIVGAVAVAGLAGSGLLWQKLSTIQEQLARQSGDAGTKSIEAHTIAKQAQDLARDTASRVAVAESRLSEAMLQRAQIDDLVQGLTRSQDENLVVDLESSLRLALQQAQVTGSVEPLLAALASANERITRTPHPRLAGLQRAMTHDVDRIKAANVVDTPGLLARLDDLLRQVDDLPTLNTAQFPGAPAALQAAAPVPSEWWQRWLGSIAEEARKLVRVSRVDQPEAALLSPEQTVFLRENLKLRLLNARLGLLARQMESVRSDLGAATTMLNKYFDPASRKTQISAGLLLDVQSRLKTTELPQLTETLAALSAATAGQ